ncbi:MAG: hypothetical protein ACK4TL_15995 [Hyphomicrobiaceae bacterium]
MFQRMILPATVCAALFGAALAAGCKETALEDIQDRPSKLGALDGAAAVASAPTRTSHFAESARPLRVHPALGPHTPAEIKRRVAILIEPPRLATPPASVLARVAPNPVEPEPRQQVASVTVQQGAPSVPAPDVTPASNTPAHQGPTRSSPRNVVIPMVVSSADGSTWRAENGDGSSAGKNESRNAHCREEALEQLKRYSASGYRIYERLEDKRMFTAWILCDERQRGLTTAVHEAVHMLTEQLDAYPLVDGGQIARIPETEKFAKPGRIAAQFKQSDDFVRTYLLPGGASSADDFTYLLDEFNSYIHDLNTAIQTQAMAPRDSHLGHRDGMSAMMSFLMAYVALAEKEDPRTWAGLHRPDVKRLIVTLWSDAERTIEKSCRVPRYAVDDQAFLRHICTPANGRALGHLLGRAPRCPRACLTAASG